MDWNFFLTAILGGVGTAVATIVAFYKFLTNRLKENENRITKLETQSITTKEADDDNETTIKSIMENCKVHTKEIVELQTQFMGFAKSEDWLTSNLTLLGTSLNRISTGVEVMTNSMNNINLRLNGIETVTKELAGEIRDIVKIVNRHDIEIQLLKEKK